MSARTVIRCSALWLLIAIASAASPAHAQRPVAAESPVQITPECTIRFATREEGIEVLTADDEFTKALTRFDLQVRLGTTEEATVDAWKKSVAAEVLDWTADDRKNVEQALARLPDKLKDFRLPLPKEVLLILTSGKEEAGAAYTRANAIILPKPTTRRSPDSSEALLLHELFHVLSRNDRDLRRALYSLIGFNLTPDIELPPSLRDRKMTNPDAPIVDCTIEVQVNGERIVAAPLIYATPAQYDPKHGNSLFNYLTFRLLVLETVDGKLQAVMKDKQPVVIDPKNVDSFYEQIGRNTAYIIHPDEILADNFVHLVLKRKQLPTPRVVDEMAKVLRR
jgi:hypothetical protein